MKTFNVPLTYRSPLISAIKNSRKQQDKMKKDFTPTLLSARPVAYLPGPSFWFLLRGRKCHRDLFPHNRIKSRQAYLFVE